MTKEDLILVLDCILESIKSNLLYQSIIKQFMDSMDDQKIESAEVGINESIYDDSLDDIDDLYVLEKDDPYLFEFKYQKDKEKIEFTIIQENDFCMIDITISYKEEYTIHDYINLNILSAESYFAKNHFVWDGDIILDASMETHYYDKGYKEIKKEQAENETNECFARYFGIPVKMAPACRNNFKMFKPFLNESRIQNVLNDNVKYSMYEFHTPFSFDGIDDFFATAYFCAEEDSVEVADVESIFDMNKWALFKKFFVEHFGVEGEFVLSDSFVDNALIYLSNKNVPMLETKGIVLKKLNDEYIVYYFEYLKGKMKKEVKKINRDEVSFILNKGSSNYFISGIKEFLGLGKER